MFNRWGITIEKSKQKLFLEKKGRRIKVRFKEYKFGFADAEKEYRRIPDLFKNAFYDPRDIVGRLINDHPFLLIGRKGVGKTAYAAKINSLSQTDEIYTQSLKLNDFEYTTFSKTSVDSELIGTQKYKQSWDFLLLLILYKALYYDLNIREVESFEKVVQFLSSIGFPIENEYKKHVAKLSKLKVGANVGVINAELESEFGEVPNTYVERLSMLIDILVAGVKDVYLDKKKLIIIIDGVDDVLRFKKNQLYIISSLVRSIDYINDLLYGILPLKIILLIRDDILSNFTDPDLNKIKRDEAINISWFDRQDELKELVNLRFLFSGISQDNIATHWNTLFPKNIREKDSWIYILEFTLGKPRDILQFLKCCQELYPEAETLNFSEVSKVLKYYARNYFIEEMKNEITGFISDDFILSLPGILQSLGSRSFSFFDFHRVSINQNHTRQPDELESKKMLQLLFDSGYLGQLYKTPSKRGEKTSVIFKYRNPTAHIDYSQKFITHRGIFRGLDVRL